MNSEAKSNDAKVIFLKVEEEPIMLERDEVIDIAKYHEVFDKQNELSQAYLDELKARFHEKDIQYQAMRSSGAGGQHVNKVSSAIRATHIPTGIAVVSMDSRSQHQNKKLATERLKQKIEANNLNQFKNQEQNTWTNQLQIERGNPIRVFQGSDFKKQKVDKSYKKEHLSVNVSRYFIRNDKCFLLFSCKIYSGFYWNCIINANRLDGCFTRMVFG